MIGLRRIKDSAERVVARVTDLLAPPSCAVCGRELECSPQPLICRVCADQLVDRDHFRCARCAAPVGRRSQTTAPLVSAGGCARCRGTRLAFAGAVALGDYQPPLQQLVIRMKHAGQQPLCMQVGELLGQSVVAAPWASAIDVIVPMPAQWWRRVRRGDNVAALLAMGIAHATGRPLLESALRFVRATAKQGTLTNPQRFDNVHRAMAARRRARLEGRRVVLVDDVMTSGATMAEARRALVGAGVADVYVAIVARGSGGS